MSFPHHVKGRARFLLGSKWGLASAQARQKLRMEHGPDWHTVRMRAMDDMRGHVLRSGCTYRHGEEVHWQLVRSRCGRLNQVDLVVNGIVWRTGSLRNAEAAIRWQKWPVAQQRIAA